MFGSPKVWHELMERLSETFLRYVRAKVDAGADAIQLFDSWVGALTIEDYEEFVAPYSERILGAFRRRRSTSARGRRTCWSRWRRPAAT
jgi:uroporphyrinogen decarboxylase